MPAVKKVIKNCICEFAKRQRRCARNKEHIITAGEKCLVVSESMKAPKSYCLPCARLILGYAKKDVEKLCNDVGIDK